MFLHFQEHHKIHVCILSCQEILLYITEACEVSTNWLMFFMLVGPNDVGFPPGMFERGVQKGWGDWGPPGGKKLRTWEIWVLKITYFKWNDSKTWNILSFSLRTRGGYSPLWCWEGGGGTDPPLAETLWCRQKQVYTCMLTWHVCIITSCY